MPGMNSGLSPGDPTLVAAFRSALLHQGAIAVIMIVFLWLIWATARTWPPGAPGRGKAAAARTGEPRGRWLLRIGFGMLWIFDGLLQAQPKMAGGLAAQVIEPISASSPVWVQHLVNWGGTVWSYHPVQAGAASVWIQIGIGAWLIAAAHGAWSRLSGAASMAWGLIVWVFGESFGGIFAPGLTWLTGAPGGVLFYVAAGALIALPEDAWRRPRSGRMLLAGLGVFFAGMAVLQAWPGRGFWQGTVHGTPGTLAGMVREMSATPQPHALSSLLAGFGSVATRYGFAVNLVVVLALAGIGALFLTGRPRLVRYAVWSGIVFCLATWVLVQDLGFLGGLGTDPNSMIPLILLFSAGYLALVPAPHEVIETGDAVETTETDESDRAGGPAGRLGRLRPGVLGRAVAMAGWRSVAAVGALAVILLGVAPMASAAANRTADPILALAISGDSASLDRPAPGFTLTDQRDRAVSLGSLRGKVVLMTFLDPVCTTRLPDHRAGVQAGRADARRTGQAGRACRRHGQPDVPFRRLHPRLRPAGRAGRRAQLAVPDRLAQPTQGGLAAVRGHRGEPAGRRDVRAQRPSRDHRSGRRYPPGAQRRPRARHHKHKVLVLRAAQPVRPPGAEALVTRMLTRILAARLHPPGRRLGSRQAGITAPALAPVTVPLSTSLVTAQGTWAVAVMGGSAAENNNFWQLFVRPAGATRWSLVTPEGVADNGGLVAVGGAASLTVGFRPSQHLAYSPLATSTDTGRTWTPGLLDAALANTPDAIAVASSGRTLALLQDGTIEAAPTKAAAAAGQWAPMITLKALAASAPGRSCGLTGVTAVSFSPDLSPVAAGSCVRAGVAGSSPRPAGPGGRRA